VAADPDRRILPWLPAPTGELTLAGALYQRLPGGLQLDDRVVPPLADRQRVGWLDVPRLAGWLGRPLYPYQLRLDRAEPGALETGWPVVAIYPQKHTGYALQWFIMAGVLALLTVLANSNLAAWLRARRQKI
jgi:cytochrome oxidase assembly protein ShyY1